MKLAEITLTEDARRLQPVIEALRQTGQAVDFESIVATEANLPEIFRDVCMRFDQIRIGPGLCSLAPSLLPRMPSTLLSLRAADAFLKQGGEWWPRNFLTEGIGRVLVADGRQIDLGGAVFVLGATCHARAAVATMTRLGFSRFSIADTDPDRGQAFVESLRESYFRVQFQFVARHLITQLPSVHTLAVNTINAGEDDGALGELFYFNFLSPGGIWLDLSLWPPNQELETEARAVGARVESGFRVAAWTDCEWAKAATGLDLDAEALAAALAVLYSPSKSDV